MARAWRWPPTPFYRRGHVWLKLYLSFSMCVLACDEAAFTFTFLGVENVSGIETTQRQFLWPNHTENNFLEDCEELRA